jgi:LPPG:FO 2-phospho-L-lactate transferase
MKIVALAGGVGGAKLADGLSQIMDPQDITIIVNTGDDFEHWGLKICPDLDTVCYTLAGLANLETGWGRAGESWLVLENISRLSGQDWFRIGDSDLATHLERTIRLKDGQPLSRVVRDFCRAWNIAPLVLPMTDQPVATMVDTLEKGELPFQEYFVHQRCEPTVKSFRFTGIDNALPAPGILDAIQQADAIIFCPSNPWVSIDPILNVKGIRSAISGKLVMAVSPIIGGQAVKGPAAKMFTELGVVPSATAVAKHYGNTLTHFVLDVQDTHLAGEIKKIGIQPLIFNTLMKSGEDRQQLAQNMLHFMKRDR